MVPVWEAVAVLRSLYPNSITILSPATAEIVPVVALAVELLNKLPVAVVAQSSGPAVEAVTMLAIVPLAVSAVLASQTQIWITETIEEARVVLTPTID